ncbi:unnamed protein product [Closterium sp. Yama58-4]|nr:unnamed protein product [Closterium sp. Yama58-4]
MRGELFGLGSPTLLFLAHPAPRHCHNAKFSSHLHHTQLHRRFFPPRSPRIPPPFTSDPPFSAPYFAAFLADMGAAHKIAAHGVAVAKKGGPSVIFEIAAGLTLGVGGASLWKMNHINEKRKTEELNAYDTGCEAHMEPIEPCWAG